MKITMDHGHYCPYCDRVVPCGNIADGSFCIFQPTSSMTCRGCEVGAITNAGRRSSQEEGV